MSKRKKKKTGLPPGTIIFTGEKKTENIDLVLMEFGCDKTNERFFVNQMPTLEVGKENTIAWYDLRGLDNVGILESFGKTFNIHQLVLEDIANIGQRPKFEEYETGFFIVAHAFHYKALERSFQTEQISFYIGQNFLISFQEDSDDIFAPIREQIKNGKEKIRQRNSDFLAYILIDFIVDHYLEALDLVEERIEKLETEVASRPSPSQKSEMYHLKRELNIFKKNIFLLREAVSRWLRADSEIIDNSTDIFLRDLLDHINLTLERAENYREMVIELQALYTAELQAKANSVINVLTIISSIFIPLTFIAGLYGMNFENMPELKWEYGYYYAIGFMVMLAISMLILFRHKKWL